MAHPLRLRLAELEAARNAGQAVTSAPPRPVGRAIAAGLMTTTALAAAPAVHAEANLPQGGRVVAGVVSVAQGASSTTVKQTSQRAIVNWDSFSVGEGHAVRFVQPGSEAAILNRVTGNATSRIAGTITGTGQVFLINPNGIAITGSGKVDVGGGFVASSLDMADRDFLDGTLSFASGGQSGAVSNAGTLSVASGGFAALLGGRVSNSGLISVPLGRIGLGAGEAATLDLTGDGFLQVALPSRAAGEDPLLEAAGRIAGARVVLRAAALAGSVRAAVSVPGVLEARGAHREGGEIVIDGGAGQVTASGTIDAAAEAPGAQGGRIAIGGSVIALTGAALDASGARGGTITVGGGWHGSAVPGLATADAVTVDAATRIAADGGETGGEVVVWSERGTSFAGTITATGGSGDGGNAEVSGRAGLAYGGKADLRSQGGETGTLLLDPYNVTISSGSDAGTSGFAATASGATINTTTLQNALATANVTVSTGASGSEAGDITVNSALSWSANTRLTLDAAGAITLNAGIANSGAGSGLTLTAAGAGGISGSGAIASNGTLTLNLTNAAASSAYAGVISGTGSLVRGGAGLLRLSGASTYSGGSTLNAGTTVLSGGTGLLGSGAINLAGGNLVFNPGSTTTTYTYANAINVTANSTLAASDGVTVLSGAVNIASGVTLTTGTAGWSGKTLTFGGAISGAGALTVQAQGLTLDGWGTSTNGAVQFNGLNTYAGATSLTTGTLRAGAANAFSANSAMTVASGATLDLAGFSGSVGSLAGAGRVRNSSATTATLTAGADNSSTTFSGVVQNGSGTVSLTKAGTGTLTLTGANTYSGSTTLTGGTLQIGDGTSGSLGGGTYAGAINLNTSGVILNFNTPSAQVLSGPITLGAAASLGNSGTSMLSVSGSIALGTRTLTLRGNGAGAGPYGGATNNMTISGGIGGTGSLVVGAASAAANVLLSGASTFSGAVTIGPTASTSNAASVLTISHSDALGTGTKIVTSTFGGELHLQNSITLANTISFSTSGAFTQNGATTSNGVIVSDSGTNTINGAISMVGGNGNTLIRAAAGSSLILNGNITSNFNSTRVLQLDGAGNITVNGALADGTSVASLIVGGLTGAATGTMTIAGANTYTGATNVAGGTLKVASSGAIGSTSAVTVAGTLDLNGTALSIASLAGAGTVTNSSATAATLTTGSGNTSTTFSGSLQDGVGRVALVKAGSGALTLSGTNSYTGATTINAGSIKAGSTGAFSADSAFSLAASGATLDIAGRNVAVGSLSGVAGSIVTNSGASAATLTTGANNADTTFAGIIQNGTSTTGLTKSGTGTLTLTGVNTATGATTINHGRLQVGGSGQLGSGTTSGMAVGTGTTFEYSSSAAQTFSAFSGAGTVTLNGSGAVTITGTPTFTGTYNLNAPTTLSGAGNLAKSGLGNAAAINIGAFVTLAGGNNSFLGFLGGPTATTVVTLNSGGTLYTAGATIHLTNGIILNGGTLASTANNSTFDTFGSFTLDNDVTVTADSTISAVNVALNNGIVNMNVSPGATLTVSGSFGRPTFGGGGALNLTGGGTLALMSANTFAGATTISNGTLRVGAAGALGGSASVTVDGTLDLYGQSLEIASLSGSGTVTNSAGSAARLIVGGGNGSTTFAGSIIDGAGGTALTKAGSGTLTLSGSNAYSGATTVSAGSLMLDGSLDRGGDTATVSVDGGATLGGTGVITAGTLALSGAGTVNLTGDNLIGSLSASGEIGALTFNNARSLVLGSIDAGSNAIAVTTTAGSDADITLGSGAVLRTSASGTAVLLAADRSFVNNAGSSTISAPNGRWLIHAASPDGNTYGGLDSGNTAVWNTANGAPVSQTGNRYAFAYQPTLTFTSTNASKTYGTDAAVSLAGNYTVSGFHGGISGAFAADDAASALSGAPSLTSDGAASDATVAGGPYAITIGAGTLTALNGYAMTFVSPGMLTIDKAALTITGNLRTRPTMGWRRPMVSRRPACWAATV